MSNTRADNDDSNKENKKDMKQTDSKKINQESDPFEFKYSYEVSPDDVPDVSLQNPTPIPITIDDEKMDEKSELNETENIRFHDEPVIPLEVKQSSDISSDSKDDQISKFEKIKQNRLDNKIQQKENNLKEIGVKQKAIKDIVEKQNLFAQNEKNLKENQDKLKGTQVNLEIADKNLGKLKAKEIGLTAEISKLEKERESLSQKIGACNSILESNSSTEGQKDKAQKNAETFNEQVTSINEKIGQLKADRVNLKNTSIPSEEIKKSELEESIKLINENITQAENYLKDNKENIKKSPKEIEMLQNKIKALEKANEKLQKYIIKHQKANVENQHSKDKDSSAGSPNKATMPLDVSSSSVVTPKTDQPQWSVTIPNATTVSIASVSSVEPKSEFSRQSTIPTASNTTTTTIMTAIVDKAENKKDLGKQSHFRHDRISGASSLLKHIVQASAWNEVSEYFKGKNFNIILPNGNDKPVQSNTSIDFVSKDKNSNFKITLNEKNITSTISKDPNVNKAEIACVVKLYIKGLGEKKDNIVIHGHVINAQGDPIVTQEIEKQLATQLVGMGRGNELINRKSCDEVLGLAPKMAIEIKPEDPKPGPEDNEKKGNIEPPKPK